MKLPFKGLLVLTSCALAGACLQACDDEDDSPKTARSEASDPRADAGAGQERPAPPVAGRKGGDDSASQAVEIRFAARVGDNAFACGERYADVGTPARTAEPVDFRFYVHDVQLIDKDGKHATVELDQDKTWQYKDTALLDFEDGSGACDQGDSVTNTSLRGKVAPGTYTAVAFKLGIPRALNHADLSSQPSPLNKSSLFWGWNMGHIFFAATSRAQSSAAPDLEAADAGAADDAGASDADDDGLNDHFTHVGSTGCDGNPTAGKPVTKCSHENRPEYTLSDFDPDKSTIIADFGAVKAGSDVAANPGCHAFTADTCTVPFAHLGIDFESGALTPKTQTLFRIE